MTGSSPTRQGNRELKKARPAAASVDDGDVKVTVPVKRAKRDTPTRMACVQCRGSKFKCDGVRPSCSRCVKLSKQCIFDVPTEGVTKMQYLRQEIKRVGDNSDHLREILEYLRCGTESEAVALLGRLRRGESVESVLATKGELQNPVSADPMTDSQSEHSGASSQHRPSIVSTDDWQSDYAHAMSMSTQYAVPNPLWMPDVDGYINAEEVGRIREDVKSLNWARNGPLQVSFQGVEWPVDLG